MKLKNSWVDPAKVNKGLITLTVYDHHLIKSNQIFSLNKLSSRELHNMQIIKSSEKPRMFYLTGSSTNFCSIAPTLLLIVAF